VILLGKQEMSHSAILNSRCGVVWWGRQSIARVNRQVIANGNPRELVFSPDMDFRSNLVGVVKAANRRENKGRILGNKPEQLCPTVLTEEPDPLVLKELSGITSRNLEIVPFKASPGDKRCTRRAPAILAMTVADAHRVKRATKTNRSAKAASLNRDATFDVHRRRRAQLVMDGDIFRLSLSMWRRYSGRKPLSSKSTHGQTFTR
jgi:hypothetical protein